MTDHPTNDEWPGILAPVPPGAWYWWQSPHPPFAIWVGNQQVASAESIAAAELICEAVNKLAPAVKEQP